jgi:hypothetical protein
MTANSPTNAHQCWCCKGVVDPTDAFCRHCGVKLPQDGNPANTHPSGHIHARLVAIEKLLLKTIFAVIGLMLLVGWVALQLRHFGRE